MFDVKPGVFKLPPPPPQLHEQTAELRIRIRIPAKRLTMEPWRLALEGPVCRPVLQIRITLMRIRIRIPYKNNPETDPHQSKNLDPDPLRLKFLPDWPPFSVSS